jgi:hypothetical protein
MLKAGGDEGMGLEAAIDDEASPPVRDRLRLDLAGGPRFAEAILFRRGEELKAQLVNQIHFQTIALGLEIFKVTPSDG